MTQKQLLVESIGWISTGTFLFSIVLPRRIQMHELGMLTSITTGIYAYSHGATAIWVKWVIAFFFHLYMRVKLMKSSSGA